MEKGVMIIYSELNDSDKVYKWVDNSILSALYNTLNNEKNIIIHKIKRISFDDYIKYYVEKKKPLKIGA